MALSGKYGKLSIRWVGDDELVFMLRAWDRLSETAIGMYRLLAASHGYQIAEGTRKDI
ncbi:hypothetical protein ACFLWS_07870 [Chloroflexota bacterium]